MLLVFTSNRESHMGVKIGQTSTAIQNGLEITAWSCPKDPRIECTDEYCRNECQGFMPRASMLGEEVLSEADGVSATREVGPTSKSLVLDEVNLCGEGLATVLRNAHLRHPSMAVHLQ